MIAKRCANSELDRRFPLSNSAPTIRHVQLRSPGANRQALQRPTFSELPHSWQRNRLWHQQLASVSSDLAELSALARRDVVSAAIAYSSCYGDFEKPDATAGIVMAGHQPALFHCGVWYKNFVLSALGQQLPATAINLVADSDLASGDSVLCPQPTQFAGPLIEQALLDRLPIDAAGPMTPWEHRKIESNDLFQSFAERAASAISPIVPDPLCRQLWPHVLSAAQSLGESSLGHVLAAGRHRLEQSVGLRTLEVPISVIAGSESFAQFVQLIATRADSFRRIHNDVLKTYRQVHSIRSTSHPVPALAADAEWTEVPFWIWQADDPRRRPLFIQANPSAISLTDRHQFRADVPTDHFCQWIIENAGRVCIRPRALMTTMYSRLLASDLFLHGIGGAKYDQLTDAIVRQFFEVDPPEFGVLTATMKLPARFERVAQADRTGIDVALRELEYHPEQAIEEPASAIKQLIERKRKMIGIVDRASDRKAWQREIASINKSLQPSVTKQREQLIETGKIIDAHLRSSKILDSREYSFSLFPESVIDELKSLVHCPSDK